LISRPVTRFYDPGLDAVRFVACALVFYHHVFSRAPQVGSRLGDIANAFAIGGGFGVIIFFTLSAYLLGKLFIIEYEATGTVQLKAFWKRRCLRIWPLYFFSIALVFTLGQFFVLPVAAVPEGIRAVALLGFVFNWFSWQPGVPSSLAGILWSVCVEEQFYVLLILLVGYFGVPRLRAIACVLIALGIVARIATLRGGLPYPAVWVMTTSHLDAFGVGLFAAADLHRREFVLPTSVRIPLCVAGICTPAVFGGLFGVSAYSGLISVFTYLWISLMTVALILALGRVPGAFDNLLGRIVVFIGRRAYGIYVYHWSALLLCPFFLHPRSRTVVGPTEIAVIAIATMGAAIASYQYLERPFLQLKRRFAIVDTVLR
jgi:peptidoglycan/LPS O-acetylase OafA/YrhL